MPNSEYCHGHNPQSIKSGGAPERNKNAWKHGLYAHYLLAEEQALLGSEVDDLAEAGLDGEIAVLRVMLKRALVADDQKSAARNALAVARLKQIQRQLEGQQAVGVVDAINTILAELGLGEGGS